MTDYYASPTGTGDGLLVGTPFKIADAWDVPIGPGDTVNLANGTYTGNRGMIAPTKEGIDPLNGSSGSPITIKATNEGEVLIDGEGTNYPMYLRHNDWWNVEGINFCNGVAAGIEILRSTDVNVKRCLAWDAGEVGDAANASPLVFAWNAETDRVLFEDCGGWGTGRYIFGAGQAANNVTFRRCYGRWCGSHWLGPKVTFQMAYTAINSIVENCVAAWTGESQQETYTLLCNSANTNPKCGNTYNNFDVDQPIGLFLHTNNDAPLINQNCKMLGCIGYVTSSDTFKGSWGASLSGWVSGTVVDNSVINLDQASHPGKRTFLGAAPAEGSVDNLTSIGGNGTSFSFPEWTSTNIDEGDALGDVGSIWTDDGNGAFALNRYIDGVETATPLWPWPMDARIKAALIISGHRTVTFGEANDSGLVTDMIAQLFGPIPGLAFPSANGTDAAEVGIAEVLTINVTSVLEETLLQLQLGQDIEFKRGVPQRIYWFYDTAFDPGNEVSAFLTLEVSSDDEVTTEQTFTNVPNSAGWNSYYVRFRELSSSYRLLIYEPSNPAILSRGETTFTVVEDAAETGMV